MAWQKSALFQPLLTLYCFIWIFPSASFGQDVNCWWNKVLSDGENVFIECHAYPPFFLQKCRHCHLQLSVPEKKAHATLHHCNRNTVHFTTTLTPQELPAVTCTLSCTGQKPGNCIIKEGYAPPTCLIPDWDYGLENIHCCWKRIRISSHPTNFTLRWKEDGENQFRPPIEVGDSDCAVIPRTQYPTNFRIRVTVSAVNALGTVHSDEAVFNTGNIREPLPPAFPEQHTHSPLEVQWEFEEGVSQQPHCEVQYKKECDLDWTEAEGIYQVVFVLDDPEPFTKYEFHVRCGLESFEDRIIMSNWSSYIVETPAAAPVGKLDVWSECESNSDDPSCIILWKELPSDQARGNISSYQVKVKLKNETELIRTEWDQCRMKVDGRAKAGQHHLTCHQEQDQYCLQYVPLTVPIREVKGICVTANSLHGESSPALVALPEPVGLRIPKVLLEVRLTSQYLTASWSSAPSTFTESIEEYVVQHKLVGLHHKLCLNWVKVDKTKNSVTLKGHFRNYTAYNIWLFAVINNCSHFLQSAVEFSVEGVPPKVTDLRVTDISISSVNLTWKPIPLDKSRGRILNYYVGISNHSVRNVSGDKNSILLSDLNADQQYELWVSARTAAGVGENTTTRFNTKTNDSTAKHTAFGILLSFAVFIAIVFSLACYCSKVRVKLWLKIPDPINSSLFQQKNSQFQQSRLLSHSSSEYAFSVSQLQVIRVPDSPLDLDDDLELIVELPEEEEEQTQSEENEEPGEDRGKDLPEPGRIERNDFDKTKDYSQMIDSSEEDASRDYNDEEEWDPDQLSPSDYEKHFLPRLDT